MLHTIRATNVYVELTPVHVVIHLLIVCCTSFTAPTSIVTAVLLKHPCDEITEESEKNKQ